MRKYSEVLKFLYKEIPIYQTQGKEALKFDLSKMKAFAKKLDNPQKRIKSIHIGGTNGKGSTVHIIAAMLQVNKKRVGIFTSPHLKDFRERIKINGIYIEKDYVVDFVNEHFNFVIERSLSFFELTFGLALQYFVDRKIDIAIIEVGMGGRLDATNIIKPEISVITNIGFDHQEFLGNSLKKIAKEKAGIIKSGAPVIIGECNKEIDDVFRKKANDKKTKIIFIDKNLNKKFDTDLAPNYQRLNINLAEHVITHLKFFKVSDKEKKLALKNVKQLTNFIGRGDILEINPRVVVDIAHNLEGFVSLRDQLLNEKYEKLHIVIGFVKNKMVNQLLPILPSSAKFYFCSPNIDRGMNLDKLCDIGSKMSISFKSFNSVKLALNKAKENATSKDLVLVTGSTFVVAEIL
ncbi:MAG: tetrahydrofolate synthase [Flavobacteriaceae bacterium]|nr:tetrahydrofolate synthase [Flavobacteriaceae bacterium]